MPLKPTEDNNSFAEYRRLIIQELENLDDRVKENTTALQDMKLAVNTLTIKLGFAASIGSIVVSTVISIALHYFFK